jgi:peroxiredoxin
MPIAAGERLPDATFKVRTAEGLRNVTTADLARHARMVLFAVPGAWTPTCHARHLPSYLEHHEALKAKGVDVIACVAVNDAFVMDAWATANEVGDKILMLSDGNAEFTKAIGLDFDGSGFGLGTRSKRYAMVVEEGVVTNLWVEETPGVMENSGADRVLAALAGA